MKPAARVVPLLVVLAGLLAPTVAFAQAEVAAIRQGNLALSADRPQEAIEAYRRALAIDPSSAIALFNLGTALASTNQFDAAVESLSHAVEAFSDPVRKADAHYNLGNVLARAGRLDDALAAYRASLRLRQDEDARVNYALVWRWRQAQGEGPAPEEPLAPQRAQEMRDKSRALDVPVVRKPAENPPVTVDR